MSSARKISQAVLSNKTWKVASTKVDGCLRCGDEQLHERTYRNQEVARNSSSRRTLDRSRRCLSMEYPQKWTCSVCHVTGSVRHGLVPMESFFSLRPRAISETLCAARLFTHPEPQAWIFWPLSSSAFAPDSDHALHRSIFRVQDARSTGLRIPILKAVPIFCEQFPCGLQAQFLKSHYSSLFVSEFPKGPGL